MDMIIRNKIKIIITIIIIASLMTFSKVFLYCLYNRSILQARVNQITVDDVNEPLTLSYLKEEKEKWDISEEKMRDIEKNPENYREVSIWVRMTNTSSYIDFYEGSLEAIYQPEFKNLMIGKHRDICIDPSLNCRANNEASRGAFFIVKCDGKTNEQIRELAKEISFTITGKTYSEALVFGEGNSKNYCKSVVEASKH